MNNSSVDDVTMCSDVTVCFSAAVDLSSRHVAASATVVPVLDAAAAKDEAAAEAEAAAKAEATADFVPTATAVANGLVTLCLGRHAHPHDISPYSSLRGPHRCSRLLPSSYPRRQELHQELGYCYFFSRSLIGRFPRGSPRPPDHSTQNFSLLQSNFHVSRASRG